MLEYKVEGERLSYRWANVVSGFAMPVMVATAGGDSTFHWIRPTESWRAEHARIAEGDSLRVDSNFLVTAKNVGAVSSAPTSRR